MSNRVLIKRGLSSNSLLMVLKNMHFSHQYIFHFAITLQLILLVCLIFYLATGSRHFAIIINFYSQQQVANQNKNFYQIISIIGVPSILTIVGLIYKREKSLRLGVQALLRAEMINDYYKYMEKGYAPLHVKENFENCYKQYHTLGANGFMDKLRDEFLALPISK